VATDTINENITLNGLDNIHETTTATSTSNFAVTQPIVTDSKARNEFAITQPIVTDSKARNEFAITQPIVTDSKAKSDSASELKVDLEPIKIESDQKSAIDVKPLAIDSCQTVVTKLAPLPPTSVDQPYCHHFGITFLGTELWGLNLNGRMGMVLESPQRARFHPSHLAAQNEPCMESTNRGLRVRIGARPENDHP
jgi:hypothetical protein